MRRHHHLAGTQFIKGISHNGGYVGGALGMEGWNPVAGGFLNNACFGEVPSVPALPVFWEALRPVSQVQH